MATEIIMPKAGMAMESGTIVSWLKAEGDYVEAGEPLLEIETDKTSMEVEAESSGYIIKILHGEGDTVPVIKPIGYLGEKGEEPPAGEAADSEQAEAVPEQGRPDRAALQAEGEAEGQDGKTTRVEPATQGFAGSKPGECSTRTVAATPAARRRAGELGVELAPIRPSGAQGEIKLRDVEGARSADAGATTQPAASSLARKIAAGEKLQLSDIEGSGPQGRIVRKDVIGALSGLRDSEPGEAGPEQRTDLSSMRRIISRRMLESHLTMPPVTLNARIDVTELFAFRKELNESSDNKFSINDLMLKAVAIAVRKHDSVRTTIEGDELVQRESVNLGMAVAVESGLLVPIINNADKLPLSAISELSKDLAERGRSGRLSPDELKGGTFTVTNLGMYGIHSFTPIINPPQSAILGINAAEPHLRHDDDGEIVERLFMMLSLTIDHRVVDGAQGAQFLVTARQLMENPLQVLV